MNRTWGGSLSLVILLALVGPDRAWSQIEVDPLDGARTLMKAGDFDGAAFRAIAMLDERPGDGAAFFVLGMARFRATRYEEALRAFAAARQSQNPPSTGSLYFNEASTYYALERYGDAEQAFVMAAKFAPELATLALLNAGQAAIDAGFVPQAKQHLAQVQQAANRDEFKEDIDELQLDIEEAETVALEMRIDAALDAGSRATREGKTSDAIALYQKAIAEAEASNASALDRAELEFALGSIYYRQRSFEMARPHLDRAALLAADDPDFHYQAAMANYRLDRADEARIHFDRALHLKIDPETAALVQTYRAALGWGLSAQDTGLVLRAQAGSGYDSNVLLMGGLRSDVVNAEYGDKESFFFTTSAEAGYTKKWRDAFSLQGSYALDQIAYSNPDADDFSLQVHNASLLTETVTGAFHAGLGLSGEYQIAGIESFSPFLSVFSLIPSIGLEEGHFTSTWLELRMARKNALDRDFYLYEGTRRDLRLTQRFRYRSARANISLRSRRENIGTNELDLGAVRQNLTGIYTVPYSYRSNAATVSGTVTPWGQLRMSVDLIFEKIEYQGDNVLRISGPRGLSNEMRLRRRDNRIATAISIAYPLGDYIDLGLRYDYVRNGSTIEFAFDDKNFEKHSVGLELSIDY
jgi:tetratricopeptide (TPR) repeat protein